MVIDKLFTSVDLQPHVPDSQAHDSLFAETYWAFRLVIQPGLTQIEPDWRLV